MESLLVCHVNAQSLPAHFVEFKHFFNNKNYDVIAVSETWFNENHSSNLYQLDNYILFRNDRERCRGGGVCLYIRSGFSCSPVSMSCEGSFPAADYLFLNLHSLHDNALIGVV